MQSENHRTAQTAAKHNLHKMKPANKMVPVLMLLMAALVAADEPIMDNSVLGESDGASASVVRCDASYGCPDGTTCCLSRYGTWNCCPYQYGHCCRDGVHCCSSLYYCTVTSTSCVAKGWMGLLTSVPSTKTIQKTQPETVHCEGNVKCPADKFCCKTAAGQWGCCSDMEL